MFRRIFSQKQKLVTLAFVAFLGIILSGFAIPVIAETLDNNVQVEPDSELTYYLKVKYDGVDKEGVQSNDATMAKTSSGRIKVTDRIPDGLIFKSFVASDNGSIGAVSRADSASSCPGRVIDDTQEESNDTGVWNTDNSEYTYHGLHYDVNSRTVSFYVERLKAGCELTVGIITQTPEAVDDPATTVVETRRDFYNTALATEGLISAPSNTVHAFMGNKNAKMYKVTYAYTGTVPGNAPALPPESEYATDSSVGVATIPSLDSYTFNGWTTSDVSISNDSFIMPAGNVVLEGYFTEKPAETKHTVTYRIDGDMPEDFVAPKEKSYPAGAEITLDSTEPGTVIDGYRFISWATEDVELSDTGFAMPEKNVVIVGKFERISYKVSYQFQGTILPPDAGTLLPATTEHYPGKTVATAAHPTADGYRFLGWYKKSTFTMPEEDVVIYGEWGLQSGTFSPTITKEIENPKASYTQGDTVRFKTTVTNTASHAIHNVMIQEQLEDAKFVTGSGYTVVSDYLAEVDNMMPGASIVLYSEFTVTKNEEKNYTNTVELIGALADDNYLLDTEKDYKANVDFTVKKVLTPAVIVGPLTEDGIVKYVFLFVVSTVCLVLAVILIRKHISFQKRTLKRIGIFVGSFVGTILLLATAGKVIAANYTVPVESVALTSTHTSYEINEPGSWNIEKSARWTGQGKAQITFEVNSVMKTSEGHKDLIFVLDNSGSMSGDKLTQVKHDASELTEILLSDSQNRAALVNFNSTAEVLSTFTNDKDSLLEKIDALNETGSTNYYQAFLKAEDVLNGYTKSQDREVVLLFLTDGHPNGQTPNEVAEYQRLKSIFPYLTVVGIQYEMGEVIHGDIINISDRQYIATIGTLNNVLFDAALVPYAYSNFVLTDYIDDEFWNIESIDSVAASIGETALSYEGTTPKVTWDISNLYRSGSSAKLTIGIKLKDKYKDNESLYPTNKKETVETRLEDTPDEVIESENTPVLKNIYEVIYEGNAPGDCSVGAMPGSEKHAVFSTVEISETVPTCSGYNFGGWEIVTDGVKKLNDGYFKMPESNVMLRATWTKVSIEKVMDGTVYALPTLYGEIASKTNGEDSGIDFAAAPSATNGNGVNTVASTAGDEYPIYYFRGAVSDNNVRFADICWKAVRTTSTGGVKLIYNGLPNASNGCTNTTSSTYGVTDIGSSAFNSSSDSPADVGYMRGNTVYTADIKDVRTSGYIFGNDVSWDGSTYTLIDTYTLGAWSSEYTKLAYNPDTGMGYHYTCGNTSTSCTSVYYLSYMASDSSDVLTLTGGVDIETAKTKMFSNETDSTIKGIIDSWYENNLKNTAVESLLEDTVFCNDRTVYDGLLKSKNDTSAVYTATIYSYYGPFGRNIENNKNAQTIAPSLQCPNVTDAFTVNVENGNGALDYPVGLLTEDELTLAGHGFSGYSDSSYLYTSRNSWSLSPLWSDGYFVASFYWDSYSLVSAVRGTHAVRPVVSLVPGTTVSDGDGSADTPWVIE